MEYKKYVDDSYDNYTLNIINGNTQRGRVYVRDGGKCRYCGKCVGAREFHADHIIPKIQGGRGTLKNLVTSCRSCNNKKRGKTPQQANMKIISLEDIEIVGSSV